MKEILRFADQSLTAIDAPSQSDAGLERGHAHRTWKKGRKIAREIAPELAPFLRVLNAMIGSKLGRYEILEVIGQGGQSIAYRARDPKIDRIVTIKQILSKKGLSETARTEFFARFTREAQAAGRLSHPNISTIYDVGGDEEGEPYIALEYVDGCSLDELIEREHPLSQARILNLFVQLCSALDYAHNTGIVHRDIKPGNIMVTRDDRVKVVDFGIARMDTSSLTQEGAVIGTPSYMSPEQIMGKPVDRRSDIFSLGVVLYETLTGEKPFKGEHSTSVIFKIIHERHASVLDRKREPVLLPDFDGILDKAMAKDPSDRYQNCAELGRILEQLLQDERLSSAPPIGRSATPASSVATAEVFASPPSNPGSGDAPRASSSVTLSLDSVPANVNARGQSDQDRTAVTNGVLPAGEVAVTTPPSGAIGESIDQSAGRTAPATDADSAASPSYADAVPPAKRRGSMLLLGTAAAVIVPLAFVVVSRIPRETVPAPPPVVTAPVKPVLATPPSAVTESLRNAQAALGRGMIVGRDGKDALHFVTAALALDPANADALELKADIRARALQQVADLGKQGKADDVQKAYDMLLEDFPGDAEIQSKHDAARATRSRAQMSAELDQSKHDAAQATLSRAEMTAELDRSKKEGAKAYEAGDFAEAVRQFGKTTLMDPRNASAFYFLGRSNAALNDLNAAVKNLTQACKLEPRNPTYNIQLARVLEKNKNFAGALTYVEKGIQLGGDGENSTTALTSRAAELRFRINLAQLTPHTFLSKHVHRRGGRCDGQLVVNESGIKYIPDEQKDHAMRARLEDIRGFAIVSNRLEVVLAGGEKFSYECTELDRLTQIAEVFSRRR